MTTATATPLATAAPAAEAQLRRLAPHLLDGFREQLPRAAQTVSRRLLGAFLRESGIGPAELAAAGIGPITAERHAFGRVEVSDVAGAGGDPAALLDRLAGTDPGTPGVAAELVDAAVNLALAHARAPSSLLTRCKEPFLTRGDADERAAGLERYATEGHNLHPCARTRLGWSVADVLAYDLEAVRLPVGFVAVRRDVHLGDDVGRLLLDDGEAGVPDPRRYAVVPVHGWQRERIRRGHYAGLVADGVLVPMAHELVGGTTAALRTILLAAEHNGIRYLKLSLDIQVTSTRRSISVASTRNGPVLSALVAKLLADAPAARPALLLAEPAGCAVRPPPGTDRATDRDFSAIARTGLASQLGQRGTGADRGAATREVAVPGAALYATPPGASGPIVGELVDRFAATRAIPDRAAAALRFIGEYATMLLPPVLWLATRHGIGLEAHLQNCLPTFVDGIPHRLVLRDMAGLRVYPPRLGAAVELWPGSVVVTGDADVLRAKVAYTALQAHLGELVVRLVYTHGLDEPAAWRAVRAVIDEVYEGLRADPAMADRAAADHAFLTAATIPHKALLGMRLASHRGSAGDRHVPVENPLR